jgi:DNA-binding MarR family transcriptional regulator
MNIPAYLTGTTQARAHRLLRMHVYGVLERYELTPTHWSILGMINESKSGLRSSEIAVSMHVKAPLVTMITHELVVRDYVISVPHHYDGRAKLLVITPAGKRFVKTVEANLREILGKLFAGLSDTELATYNKVLQTMITNGEQM